MKLKRASFLSFAVPMKKFVRLLGVSFLGFVLSQSVALGISIFSTGMVQPETISPAPDNFAGHGGDYFVPDFGGSVPANSKIWIVPQGGGSPTQFVATPDAFYRGGTFLPSNWGAMAGDFVTTGVSAGSPAGRVDIFSSTGTRTIFESVAGDSFGTPLIAPGSFGTFGGDLLVTGVNSNSLFAVAPSGTITTVASSGLPLDPGALAFSPTNFGSRSNELFVDSLFGGKIETVDANGTALPFATIPLKPGQISTVQMAFSPAGFFSGMGPLLFVSVRASTAGGGALGDVYALNANGTIVEDLRTDLGLTAFDPRGLFFPTANSLLISNTSDSAHSMLLVTSTDFKAVPDSGSTFGLLFGSLVGLFGVARLRFRQLA